MSDRSRWERYQQSCREAAALGVVEVTFKLPPDRLPMKTESMWAQQVGPDLFVLRNSPFYAEGVSFLDTVRARLRHGQWFFVEVYARAGHSTFRVRLTDRSLRLPWRRALAPLTRLGCVLEGADERWTTVDVPPGVDAQAVAAALRRGEREGRWEVEEAHYGHPMA